MNLSYKYLGCVVGAFALYVLGLAGEVIIINNRINKDLRLIRQDFSELERMAVESNANHVKLLCAADRIEENLIGADESLKKYDAEMHKYSDDFLRNLEALNKRLIAYYEKNSRK